MKPDFHSAHERGFLQLGWERFARRTGWLCLIVGIYCFAQTSFGAEQRFPPPEFESGYVIPVAQKPLPRALLLQYVDVFVLLAALGFALYFVYRKRSRSGVVFLSLFSLGYFGFYREGCICSIGSIQNVALALFDSSYAIPLAALLFFLAPLVTALVAGRAFCSGVCPHGALQDLVLLKPIPVPLWLERALGVVPFVYLGAAVVLAATGSTFLICVYDPFVPLFRFSGTPFLLGLGAIFLIVGMFVGRPYCRFLCPYGALLKVAGKVSKWQVRITPNECTQCRLCENACPFGVIRTPAAETLTPKQLRQERAGLGWLFALVPLLIIVSAAAGYLLSVPASRLHPTVQLAEKFFAQKKSPVVYGRQTAAALALQRAQENSVRVTTDALAVRSKFKRAGLVFGGWTGGVLGCALIGVSLRSRRTEFEPDGGACFACARCFESCPNELVRRGFFTGNVSSAPPQIAEKK